MFNKTVQKTLEFIRSKPIIGILILSAFYFFGIIGINSNQADWYIEKTAFNLLLSLIILLLYQKTFNYRLWMGFLFCYLAGFIAEYIGVTYGVLFGSYQYPLTLGPQLGGVPLIIGVNWFLLTFCVWALLKNIPVRSIFLIIPAALITVAIDMLIEPIAIVLDFWKWENDVIPMQNYVGWAIISLLIYCFYALVKIPTKNKIYVALLLWQIIFFLSLNILL